jgi:hypothetical protein
MGKLNLMNELFLRIDLLLIFDISRIFWGLLNSGKFLRNSGMINDFSLGASTYYAGKVTINFQF